MDKRNIIDVKFRLKTSAVVNVLLFLALRF